MNPTGKLAVTPHGRDLILTRTYRAPIEDVWASVTEPERTARWYGPWKGSAAPGSTIQVRMSFEEGQPWFDMRIEACEPPHRLALSASGESGDLHIELQLTHTKGTTELTLIHRMTPEESVAEMGPGWEYYLDNLTAARQNTPQPDFTDYFPAMKPYYNALT